MAKRKKKKNKINILFEIPLFIASIIFLYAVFIIDILIPKYLSILIGIIFILNITNLFLLKRKSKKIKGLAIFCTLLFYSTKTPPCISIYSCISSIMP